MESSSMIDMSLDDIIKLNRKTKATASKPQTKARTLSLRRMNALRPSLVRPMKSRQVSAARAIFQRAKRTAAIAARVAADAAALVAPSSVGAQSGRRNGPVGATWSNRPINRNLAVRQRIMAVNRQIFQRQRTNNRIRQGAIGRQGVQSQRLQSAQQVRLQGRLQRRPMNTRILPRNNSNSNIVTSNNIRRRNLSFNDSGGQRQVNRIGNQNFAIRRRGGSGGLVVRTQANAMPTRYQQYIQQARALIRAQEERQNDNLGGYNNRTNHSIYVDVPARNGGIGGLSSNRYVGRNGARGRFRR